VKNHAIFLQSHINAPNKLKSIKKTISNELAKRNAKIIISNSGQAADNANAQGVHTLHNGIDSNTQSKKGKK